MNFNEYQEKCNLTAQYPKPISSNLLYPVLGLVGETGEFCEKLKKIYRDKDGVFNEFDLIEMKKEMGDILWYLSTICTELNFNLDEVAEGNIKKLLSRKERGVINGNGDNR